MGCSDCLKKFCFWIIYILTCGYCCNTCRPEDSTSETQHTDVETPASVKDQRSSCSDTNDTKHLVSNEQLNYDTFPENRDAPVTNVDLNTNDNQSYEQNAEQSPSPAGNPFKGDQLNDGQTDSHDMSLKSVEETKDQCVIDISGQNYEGDESRGTVTDPCHISIEIDNSSDNTTRKTDLDSPKTFTPCSPDITPPPLQRIDSMDVDASNRSDIDALSDNTTPKFTVDSYKPATPCSRDITPPPLQRIDSMDVDASNTIDIDNSSDNTTSKIAVDPSKPITPCPRDYTSPPCPQPPPFQRTDSLYVDASIWTYLEKYHKHDLDSFCGTQAKYTYFHTTHTLQIESIENQSVSDISEKIVSWYQQIMETTSKECLSLSQDAIDQSFKNAAKELAEESNCVCIIDKAASTCCIVGPKDALFELKKDILRLSSDEFLRFTTSCGIVVQVFQHDLLHEKVEAIVNPANSKLGHGGGAAKAIADAAGKQLVDECAEFIRQHKQLNCTEVMHTSAWNLNPPIQYVLHAAGPPAQNYPDVNELFTALFNTFYNCLCYANTELKVKSLSIPAISSGIYGASKDLVAHAAYEALMKFDKKCRTGDLLPTLKAVHFVNNDSDTSRVFIDKFKECQQSQLADGDGADLVKISSMYGKQDSSRHTAIPIHDLPAAPYVGDRFSFTTPKGIGVKIYRQNLLSEQVEAVVCPVDSQLTFGGGAAAAIANSAGSVMIQECKDFLSANGSLDVTNVKYVSAGNLKPQIKHVILAAGPHADQDANINELHKAVYYTFLNCLRCADTELEVTSLSIPAISSGVFGVPKQLVADAAYYALMDFQASGTHYVSDVRFVNVDLETTQVFVSIFKQNHQSGTSTQHDIDHSVRSSPQPYLAQHKVTSMDVGEGFSFVSSSGIGVEIYKQDLLLEKVDAIVCSVDTNLHLGGGAAKAVANAVGSQLVDDCNDFLTKHGSLGASQVTHVAAGDLSPTIKHVILAVGPSPGVGLDQGLHVALVDTFFNCLQYANNTLRISSISIPAIGSGISGVSTELVARAAYDALLKFDGMVLKGVVRNLNSVHFVNIEAQTSASFAAVFRERLGKVDRPISATDPANGQQAQTTLQLPASMHHFVAGKQQQRVRRLKRPVVQPQPIVDTTESTSPITAAASGDSVVPMDVETQQNKRSRQLKRSSDNDAQQRSTADDGGDDVSGSPIAVSDASLAKKSKDSDSSVPSVDLVGVTNATKVDEEEKKEEEEEEDCVICMCPIMDQKQLACGHKFCNECIDQYFDKCQPKCPSCGRLYGVMKGNQPPGTMDITIMPQSLAGYETCGTIRIEYDIPDGTQTDIHPNPGVQYYGTQRTGLLPNNDEGKEVCELLKQAFDARLIFTVGRSITTGADNMVIWNDIHHKTSFTGQYGYPDPTYLSRVKTELAAKGINVGSS